MTTRQLRRYDMLVRISTFGAVHRDRFPSSTPAGRAFAAVHDAVAELESRAVTLMGARQEDVQARRDARARLVAMLRALHRTARVIQEEQPDFPGTFRMPARSAHGVLMAARLAIRDLKAVAQVFINYGLPQTVVADLRGAFERYEHEIRCQEMGKSARAAARAGLEAPMAAAMVAVRRLDVILANALRDDRAASAVWAHGRRVTSAKRVATQPNDAVTAVTAPPAAVESESEAPRRLQILPEREALMRRTWVVNASPLIVLAETSPSTAALDDAWFRAGWSRDRSGRLKQSRADTVRVICRTKVDHMMRG